MFSEKFAEAIKVVSSKLEKAHINYAIIGSTNCALQGMNLSPKDLDLVVKLKDLEKLPAIFKEYSPSSVEKLFPDSKDLTWTTKLANHPAFDVRANIREIEVQVLGEKDDGEYVSKLIANRIIYVHFNELRLPCFTLEAEAEAYEETYRAKKAERIREFIKNNKTPR